jgi:hypothetical protein
MVEGLLRENGSWNGSQCAERRPGRSGGIVEVGLAGNALAGKIDNRSSGTLTILSTGAASLFFAAVADGSAGLPRRLESEPCCLRQPRMVRHCALKQRPKAAWLKCD